MGLLVSAGFAYLAVRNVHLGDVWDGLRSSDYGWLVPAFALLVLTVYLRALRWRYVFAPATRPPMRHVAPALLIGYFFNCVLPARAGEAARVLALRQRAGTSPAEATGTVVVERAYDLVVLLAMLFAALPWLPEVSWLRAAGVLGLGVAAAMAVAGVALAVWGLRPLHFFLRPFGWLPFVPADRLERVGERLGEGLAAIRRPSLVVVAIALTAAGWLALAASCWCVIRGFHLDLPLTAGLLVVVATNLVQILPSSPSAVGVFEAAAVVALGAYDVPDSQALACALAIHALNVVPMILIGLFLVRGSLRELSGGTPVAVAGASTYAEGHGASPDRDRAEPLS